MANEVENLKFDLQIQIWIYFHWIRDSKFVWNMALYGKAFGRNVETISNSRTCPAVRLITFHEGRPPNKQYKPQHWL